MYQPGDLIETILLPRNFGGEYVTPYVGFKVEESAISYQETIKLHPEYIKFVFLVTSVIQNHTGILIPNIAILSPRGCLAKLYSLSSQNNLVHNAYVQKFTGKLCSKCGFSCRQKCSDIVRI
jgi:hypothetical protein